MNNKVSEVPIPKGCPSQELGVLRLVCLSDTHSNHHHLKVPMGDILIHAGDVIDVPTGGLVEQVKVFNKWIGQLPHKHKLVIPGNHDILLDDNVRKRLMESGAIEEDVVIDNAVVLANSAITLEGLTFSGFPQSLADPAKFDTWPFGVRKDSDMEVLLKDMEPTDIFVSHTPPKHTGCDNKSHFGSESILAHVLHHQPFFHFFGHVHAGRGQYKIDGTDTVFINGAEYRPTHMKAPIVVDVDKEKKVVVGVYTDDDINIEAS